MKRGGGRAGAGGGGEIIQVQGGHIIRATGRKDRHSKVYTAKGPRDRRVRLSAHTAIQFYDVQDRLGYDRPSKAVDWLINKAKTAIDRLSQSSMDPIIITTPTEEDNIDNSNPVPGSVCQVQLQQQQQQQQQPQHGSSSWNYDLVIGGPVESNNNISDSMKSFFPMTTSSDQNSLMNFQRISRDGIHNQNNGDLGLSLQTLQQDQNLNPVVQFQANFAKNEAWNAGGEEGENRNVGFILNSNSMPYNYTQNSSSSSSAAAAALLREPLQSNNINYSHLIIPSWNIDQRQFPPSHHHVDIHQSSSFYGVHFDSNFQIPTQIHAEEQPSSVSPTSQQI
ncbi:hypothetical protein M9H77_21131 [Catharanthus roseus]|uniref:Uncharacterized protein n=1 Tax=Catharanthus roseus TaxID=4058 RepID=A0ACC0AQT7_CATRO|nr:hypothetical protein M9H77_21131 [Catharanthus roseus]